MSRFPRVVPRRVCGDRRQVRHSVDAATYVCASCGPTVMRPPVDDPQWRAHAACATVEGRMVMEYAAEGYDPAVTDAKALCARCPVTDACLMSAITTEQGGKPADRWGVRGGRTAAERFDLHKQQRKAGAA